MGRPPFSGFSLECGSWTSAFTAFAYWQEARLSPFFLAFGIPLIRPHAWDMDLGGAGGDMMAQSRKGVTTMATTMYAIELGCYSHSPVHPCRIWLPRESPLRKAEHLDFQPKGSWPVMFLCLQHMQWCMRSELNVHPDIEARDLDRRLPPLLLIQCRCALGHCRKLHTIYAARIWDWSLILKKLVAQQPRIPCGENGEHALKWREDLIQHEMFAHDSPMR